VDAVNRVASQLSNGNEADGEADVLIAEYHEGAGETVPEGSSLAQEIAASQIFAKIVNQTAATVDVIFTGHTHKRYASLSPDPAGRPRPIVQTGSYGEAIGKVVMTVDDVTGNVISFDTVTNVLRPNLPTGTTPAQSLAHDETLAAADPEVAQVKAIRDAAVAYADQVGGVAIGSVTADITRAGTGGTYTNGVYTGGGTDDRSRESTLGNLVADALLDKLSAPALGAAEIGVVNPGGMRDDFLRGADGVITIKEAVNVLPFANSLFTISLTGAQFKTLLEQQWQRLPNGTIPGNRPYLQLGLSENVTYTFDPSLPEGSRITSITVNGLPIDPSASYRIGSFSFLVEGGDNFHVFRQGTNKRDTGLIDRDAWIEYLTENSPLSPNFARQSVQVTPAFPVTAAPGQQLKFTVSNLDLTSQGSPRNTELEVYVGGMRIVTVPVVDGAASIDVVVPADLPTAARNVMLVARPSGTVVNARTHNSIPPTRLFDTRGPSESPNAQRTVPIGKVGGATELRVKAADLAGLIPAGGVTAVSMNVAVTNPEGPGFVTVYDCSTRRLVASVNYLRGETVSNAVIAPVSPQGDVCFYSLAAADIVVDVNGWFDGGYNGIQPNRVFDTRAGESPNALRTVPKTQVSGDAVLEVKVTDLGDDGSLVPGANVSAVSLNVAVTNPARAGFVTVYPCGARHLVSSINFAAGETISNAVVVPVSPTGTLCFYSPNPADIVVDVNGWFAAGSGFRGVTPSRLFDTRPNEPGNAAIAVAKSKVATTPLEVKVAGLSGLTPETGAGAVVLNVAITNPAAAGFVTVYPCGNRPFTANVNFAAGETVSNAVIAPLSSAGTICFYSLVSTDIVVDINGWFQT
jgi:2',3'-cyclic-nucleotide 2'-phosphodiesterase (5'-nucleotidase family)